MSENDLERFRSALAEEEALLAIAAEIPALEATAAADALAYSEFISEQKRLREAPLVKASLLASVARVSGERAGEAREANRRLASLYRRDFQLFGVAPPEPEPTVGMISHGNLPPRESEVPPPANLGNCYPRAPIATE